MLGPWINSGALLLGGALGALLGKIPTVLLLILCAGGYLICSVWYLIATRRFIKKPASNEAGV